MAHWDSGKLIRHEHQKRSEKRVPAPLARLKAFSGGRNFLLLVDTAATSLTTMVLVVAAARSLSAHQLDSFALAQLVIVTAIGIMRSAVYSPAMAAQRTTGRAYIPLRWTLLLGLPLTVVVSILTSPFLGDGLAGALHWTLVVAVVLFSGVMQDGVRTVLVSRDLVRLAVVSDFAVLMTMLVIWATGLLPHRADGMLLVWAAAGLVGLVLGLFFTRTHATPVAMVAQSLHSIWRLSRWAAIDIGFASIATLMPYFVATAALDGNTAGTYRTLQTALGPLNIVHTTVVTALGLDAWKMATRQGLEKVHRQVSRLTVLLTLGGSLYSVAAVSLMVLVTGLEHPSLTRIAIVMIVTATLGAANSGYNAAALSLGYQRSGAILRFVMVVASVVISLPWSARTWVPWQDPIGTSALFTATVTFIGWALSYAVGYRREHRAHLRPRRALED